MNDTERWKAIEKAQSDLVLSLQGIKERVWKALCEELFDAEQAVTRLSELLDETNPTPLDDDL